MKCSICNREKEIKSTLHYKGTMVADFKLCERCDYYFRREIRNRFRLANQYDKGIE